MGGSLGIGHGWKRGCFEGVEKFRQVPSEIHPSNGLCIIFEGQTILICVFTILFLLKVMCVILLNKKSKRRIYKELGKTRWVSS